MPVVAAPTTVLVIVKRFNYRGDANEEWSNRYMLTGATPADSTAWRALFDALVAEEKKLYAASTAVIKGYAYNKVPVKGDSAVWNVDMRVAPNAVVPGTFVGSPYTPGPGDTAGWVRWGLDRFVNGKRVYLRKYFHPAYLDTSGFDALATTWKTAATAFGGKMRDGTFLDARTVTDRLGSAVVGAGVSSYPTTRTLKRRGKRPPTTP